jgi:hypothetical protein
VVVVPITTVLFQLRWYIGNESLRYGLLVGMREVGWQWALAGMALAALSGSTLVHDRRRWWRIAIGIMVATVVISAVTTLARAADPVNNVLGRDIFGAIVFSAAIPLICAGVARLTAGLFASRWMASGCCLVVGAACLLSSPFVLVGIHCSSGDCM